MKMELTGGTIRTPVDGAVKLGYTLNLLPMEVCMTHCQRLIQLTIVTLAFLAVTAIPPACAQSCEEGSAAAYFQLYVDQFGGTCPLVLPTGLVTVNILVNAIPFQKARLQLPDSPLGQTLGVTWVGTTTGDRLTGIEIDMGGCVGPGSVSLGTMFLEITPEDSVSCTDWEILAGCEVQDCDGVWRPATPVQHQVGTDPQGCIDCCWQCCYGSLSPYNLYPRDGASGVPLTAQFSWETMIDVTSNPPFSGCSVTISTDPTCGSGTVYPVDCSTAKFSPDFLEPGTTYYWRVSWFIQDGGCSDGLWGYSPWHSFTTGGPSPAESKTWGSVKALYR